MNKYPYSAGHLMVVPYRKINQLGDLTEEEVMETWKLCVHAQQLLTICVRAQGFNVGWNIGRAGGAGVDDHLHLHVVPRWIGDSNFMTTISEQGSFPKDWPRSTSASAKPTARSKAERRFPMKKLLAGLLLLWAVWWIFFRETPAQEPPEGFRLPDDPDQHLINEAAWEHKGWTIRPSPRTKCAPGC